MILKEVIQAVDQLTPEERAALQAHLDQLKQQDQLRRIDPEERIRRMDEAARMIREDLTAEQWAELEQAMNAEYIEPWDESMWED